MKPLGSINNFWQLQRHSEPEVWYINNYEAESLTKAGWAEVELKLNLSTGN